MVFYTSFIYFLFSRMGNSCEHTNYYPQIPPSFIIPKFLSYGALGSGDYMIMQVKDKFILLIQRKLILTY